MLSFCILWKRLQKCVVTSTHIVLSVVSVPTSAFELSGTSWPTSSPGNAVITYSYSNLLDGNLGGSLSAEELRLATEEALNVWAAVAPLHFDETGDSGPLPTTDPDDNTGYAATGHPDIRVGHHVIGGANSTLAHAFFPPTSGGGTADGSSGDIHLDSVESFQIGHGANWDVVEVLVHEIGHALGLDHESGTTAIMNPNTSSSYSGLGTAFLRPDDINGIQAIYGNGNGRVVSFNSTFDRVWRRAENGSFGSSIHWSGIVPNSARRARFNRPGSYIVTLNSNSHIEELWIERGGVTFNTSATLEIDSSANVGSDNAVLNIAGTGVIDVGTDFYVGKLFGDIGHVNVTTGLLVARQQLIIGLDGQGSLDMATGSRVVAEGQTGDSLYIGRRGNGTLNQTGGILEALTPAFIGVEAGSNGDYNFSGGDAFFSSNLVVGLDGDGEVDHSGSADAEVDGDLTLGLNSAGSGVYQKTGGTLAAKANLFVGFGGTGALTQTAGTVWVTDKLILGQSLGGDGTLTIDGGVITGIAPSNDVDIIVGNSGVGTLTVSSGGTLNASDDLHLGLSSIGMGTVNLSGGTITTGASPSGGDVFVGSGGQGTFTHNIGTLDVDDDLIVAHQANSIGTYTLSGGSVIVHDGFTLASNGVGDFNQSSGQIQVVGDTVVGFLSDSQGTYRMTGGSLSLGTELTIGRNGDSNGAMTVDSGTVELPSNTGDVFVGRSGHGTLTVINGGMASFGDDMEIGLNPTGDGTVTVGGNGTPALISINDGVGIGVSGTGRLDVLAGGTFTAGNTNVGQVVGATGTLKVVGAGSVLDVSRLNVGGTLSNGGSTGTATIGSGGEVQVTNAVTIWDGGTVNLQDGSLTAQSVDHAHGGEFNFFDGELSIEVFDGNLEQQGGTLAPDATLGSIAIAGNYIMNAGTLAIEIGGLIAGAEFDQIVVDGTAALAGALDLSLVNDFMPNFGDVFKIVDAEFLFGDFVGLPEGATLVADGFEFDISYLADEGTDVELTVTGFLGSADFDTDFDVDSGDLALWQGDFGISGGADADRDGDSDGADFLAWQRQYTGSITVALPATVVPEPTSIIPDYSRVVLRIDRTIA